MSPKNQNVNPIEYLTIVCHGNTVSWLTLMVRFNQKKYVLFYYISELEPERKHPRIFTTPWQPSARPTPQKPIYIHKNGHNTSPIYAGSHRRNGGLYKCHLAFIFKIYFYPQLSNIFTIFKIAYLCDISALINALI